ASSMMALVRGRSQRSSSTGVAVRSSHARSTTRNHFSSRTATLPRCGNGATLALGSRGHSAGGHDHDVLERRILIALALSGAQTRDLVDDLHALRDAAKDRVPEVARAVIEEGVVREVHEELRGGAVDVAGARHGERAAEVLQPVLRLVADRRARALVHEICGESPALDDEARHDAMKDRAVEVAVVDVALEVLDRDGRFLREQLHHEGAVRSLESDHAACPSVTRSWPARSGCERTQRKPARTSAS